VSLNISFKQNITKRELESEPCKVKVYFQIQRALVFERTVCATYVAAQEIDPRLEVQSKMT
jgi:hypothetical protein